MNDLIRERVRRKQQRGARTLGFGVEEGEDAPEQQQAVDGTPGSGTGASPEPEPTAGEVMNAAIRYSASRRRR